MMRLPKRRQQGYGIVEILGFMGAIALMAALSWPVITKVEAEQVEARRSHVLAMLETAKNKYDQDAQIAEKEKFNNFGDSERFEILAPFMGVQSSEEMIGGAKVKTLLINKLGENVEIIR